MTYRTEFEDYPPIDASLEAMLKAHAMEDVSWHNDTCPSWLGADHQLYVDYADLALRENGDEWTDCGRYILYPVDDEGQLVCDPDDVAREGVVSDDLDVIDAHLKAWAVAKTFGGRLAEYLSPEEMAKAIKRNRSERDPKYQIMVCHSHDFCDANMAMLEAMEANGYVELMPLDDGYSSVWRKAWSIAVKQDFFYQKGTGE